MSKTLDKKDITAGDLVYYFHDGIKRALRYTSDFHVSEISHVNNVPASLFRRDYVWGLIRKGVFHYVKEI